MNEEDPQPEEQLPIAGEPDRPLECSECRRPVTTWYTEVDSESIQEYHMCSDCPELQRRLGHLSLDSIETSSSGEKTGLCCGSCGTTLHMVQMGQPLGCSNCYEVFGDILLNELVAAKRVAQRLAKAKRSRPIHIGRSPGEAATLNPSLRLVALNEALNETLTREDYEQAAWLRDQIKELTEKPNEPEEKDSSH